MYTPHPVGLTCFVQWCLSVLKTTRLSCRLSYTPLRAATCSKTCRQRTEKTISSRSDVIVTGEIPRSKSQSSISVACNKLSTSNIVKLFQSTACKYTTIMSTTPESVTKCCKSNRVWTRL